MLFRHRRLLHYGIVAFDLAIVGWSVLLSSADPAIRDWSDLVELFTPVVRWDLFGFAALAGLLWWLAATRLNIYRSRRTESFAREFFSIVEAWIVVTAVALLVLHVAWIGELGSTRGPQPVSSAKMLANGVLLFAAQRFVVRTGLSLLRFRGRNTRSLLFVGWGPAAESFQVALSTHPHFGIHSSGVVPFAGEELPGDLPLTDLSDRGGLEAVLSEIHPQIVLITPPRSASMSDVTRAFELCDEAGLPCALSSPVMGSYLRPRIDEFAGAPVIAFMPAQFGEAAAFVKRGFDFTFALVAILLASPLLIGIALAIRIRDGAPILFRQRRVGRFGREFTCLKFRTMVVGADAMKADLAAQNEEDGPAFKMKNDPRVTRVGKLLRRYSLDELPQLFNVLVGDMSFVGPRPPTPDEVQQYEWAWRRRLSVRPGLTCIWQIWGRNKVPFRRWMEMDLWYIDSWSLWKDVKLILRTLLVVLRGTGS